MRGALRNREEPPKEGRAEAAPFKQSRGRFAPEERCEPYEEEHATPRGATPRGATPRGATPATPARTLEPLDLRPDESNLRLCVCVCNCVTLLAVPLRTCV